MTNELCAGIGPAPRNLARERGEGIDAWLLRFEAACDGAGKPLAQAYDTANASRSPAVALKLAERVLASLVYHANDANDARGGPGSAPPRSRDAAVCAARLYAAALRWELAAQAEHVRARAGSSAADSAGRGETERPAVRDWDASTSNDSPGATTGSAPDRALSRPRDKILLDAVSGLSRLYRDNAIPRGDLRPCSPSLGLSANLWLEGVRSAQLVLDRLDEDTGLGSSPLSCTIKAHALHILSVADPDEGDMYLRRLAELPDSGETLLPEGDALVFSALRRMSMSSPRCGTAPLNPGRAPVPDCTILPPSPASSSPVAFPSSPSPIPFPSSHSHTHSRTHSRSDSLFSVVVTPASYVSAATSPSLSNTSPLSGSLDCKPVPVHESRCRNPLLDRALGRRARRAHSLHGTPTLALTRCNSQSMGSFAPPECAVPDSSASLSVASAPRLRAVSHGRAVAAERPGASQRSATLPSAGTATRSLKALYAQVDDRATARRVRPPLPWAKTWWSVSPDAAAPAPPAVSRSPTAVSAKTCDPDTPGLDAVLARQERASRLLGSRQCATCGARGGSFPQCARGCGVAWCSRDCRMENRKAHKEACAVAVGRVTVG